MRQQPALASCSTRPEIDRNVKHKPQNEWVRVMCTCVCAAQGHTKGHEIKHTQWYWIRGCYICLPRSRTLFIAAMVKTVTYNCLHKHGRVPSRAWVRWGGGGSITVSCQLNRSYRTCGTDTPGLVKARCLGKGARQGGHHRYGYAVDQSQLHELTWNISDQIRIFAVWWTWIMSNTIWASLKLLQNVEGCLGENNNKYTTGCCALLSW